MKKNSFVVIILILTIICIMATACQTKGSSVFSNECIAPCWRHIQPGQTTEKEVNDLLSDFSDVRANEVGRGGSAESIAKYITFDLSTGVNVRIYLIHNVVVQIQFANLGGITTFGDCVKEFGTPEFAVQSSVMGYGLPLGATSDWHTWFYALSANEGIAYGYDTYRYFGKNAGLTPKTKVTVIELYDVNSFETLLGGGLLINVDLPKRLTVENLYPWVGYGDIDKLYPEKQ